MQGNYSFIAIRQRTLVRGHVYAWKGMVANIVSKIIDP